MGFTIRALSYICAFIGAGWFGDWAYLTVETWGWTHLLRDQAFLTIVVAGVVGGVLAAFLEATLRSTARNRE